MSQQGPVVQPQQKSGMPGWLMGCGIGCGLVALAAVVGIVVVGGLGYFVVKKGMDEGKDEFIAQLNAEYEKQIQNNAIAEEHRPLFDELHALGTDAATSFPAVLMCLVAIQSTLEDGQVSEEDVKLATEVRDFVKNNPRPASSAWAPFDGTSEFQKMFDEAQQNSTCLWTPARSRIQWNPVKTLSPFRGRLGKPCRRSRPPRRREGVPATEKARGLYLLEESRHGSSSRQVGN